MACVACFDRRVSCKQVAALLRGHPRLSLLDMRMLYWRTDAHVDSSRDHQTHKGLGPSRPALIMTLQS